MSKHVNTGTGWLEVVESSNAADKTLILLPTLFY